MDDGVAVGAAISSTDPARRLPTTLTSFVGRAEALERLTRELGVHRLVTLTGPGGVGKTRTAFTVAATWGTTHRSQVVELASVTESSQIAPAVATALAVSDQSNRDAVDRIVGHLAGSTTLLVLDNCEHLVDGVVRLVLRLLAALPGLSVLATSRQPLAVRGEQEHRLDPLPVPLDADARGDRPLEDVPSVRLLLDRVHGFLPGFAVTTGNRASVVALCRLLDGLPLAIELAAVRLRSLSVAQVVERLDGRLINLAVPRHDTEVRHQSLRALIDWSFELCSSNEQVLWARMSVFPAPADLPALEGVCGYGDLQGDSLLDALDGLIGKSVVAVDRDDETLRYRQFVPLREYGAEQLAHTGDTDAVRRRHRDYFIELTTDMVDRWCGPDQAADLARLREDHPNLVAALAFSADRSEEAVAGARLASLLRYHWIAGGFLTYGRRWLERLLARLESGTSSRGEALWVAAWVALIQGDRDVAREYLAECTAIADDVDDLAMRGHAAHWTALLALFEGRLDESVDRYEQAIRLHRTIGDTSAELTAAFQLGMAQTYAGHHDEALSTAAGVVDRASRNGEAWNRGYGRWVEAIAHLHVGDLDRARVAILETITIEQDFRDSVCTALSIETCSWIAVALDRAHDAAVLSGLSRSVWGRIGTSLAAFGPHAFDEGRRNTERINAALGTGEADTLRRRHPGVDVGGAVEICRDILTETDNPSPEPPARVAVGDLTAREYEVASMIAAGCSNKQIAQRLVISRRTVDGHVERILRKLSFGSRTQVAGWFLTFELSSASRDGGA